MISKQLIPIWPVDCQTAYYSTYIQIINNFEKAFETKYPNSQILFIDNTYKNAQEVSNIIGTSDCDVVALFSLVDPPYTWHYLKEVLSANFPSLTIRYIGNQSPDISVDFWWLWCINELPAYDTQQLLPQNFSNIYLSYNSKPHDHRIKFYETIKSNSLEHLGIITLGKQTYQEGIAQSIGDITVWQSHFLTIVGCTVFRIGNAELLVSEKEFKPLLGLRPFVINGSARYYQVLEKLGFDLFDDLLPIDQLRQEKDTVEATMNYCHNTISDLIRDLSKQNLDLLYAKMLPRLQANRQHVLDHGKYLVNKWCHAPIEL